MGLVSNKLWETCSSSNFTIGRTTIEFFKGLISEFYVFRNWPVIRKYQIYVPLKILFGFVYMKSPSIRGLIWLPRPLGIKWKILKKVDRAGFCNFVLMWIFLSLWREVLWSNMGNPMKIFFKYKRLLDFF